MDGIENQILPPACIDENPSVKEGQESTEVFRLPKSLSEAVEAFAGDELIQSVIGRELSQKYMQAKKREYQDYCAQVTDWELDRYLYRI